MSGAESLSEIRTRAWKTRREKYGPHGHHGSYSRGPCQTCDRMGALIIRLCALGDLSEGQAAKAMDLHRIEIRRRVDEYNLSAPTGGSDAKR